VHGQEGGGRARKVEGRTGAEGGGWGREAGGREHAKKGERWEEWKEGWRWDEIQNAKVAENPHRFGRHRSKIGPNPNVLAYSKSPSTWANMYYWVCE